MSSADDFLIISELGKVKFISGKGSFGSVYKVKRKADGEIYAMKKVLITKLNPKERDNAINEIRILASISNDNIISYKDAFYDDRSSYLSIIMEYADDCDLESKINQKIKSNTFYKENEVINIFAQILNGLKALHSRKIIHRDLKSANIFLTKNGVVKIGDLNVSKVIKMGLGYTQTGTPYYAAPEIWKDIPYDYKTDIWSLGCILYEMACLKPPFRGNNMEAVYNKIIKGKYKVYKGIYDPLPKFYCKELSDIVSMLLTDSPSLRPKCDKIIEILHKTEKFSLFIFPNVEKDVEDSDFMLLNTIKMPRNIKDINKILPKSNYIKKRILRPNNINLSSNNLKNQITYIKTEPMDENININENPLKQNKIVTKEKIDKIKPKYNLNHIPLPQFPGLSKYKEQSNYYNYNNNIKYSNNYNQALNKSNVSQKEEVIIKTRASSSKKENKHNSNMVLPIIHQKVLNLSKLDDKYESLKTEILSKNPPLNNIPINRLVLKYIPKKLYIPLKHNYIPSSKLDLSHLK